jgi:endoglucanase Acf2
LVLAIGLGLGVSFATREHQPAPRPLEGRTTAIAALPTIQAPEQEKTKTPAAIHTSPTVEEPEHSAVLKWPMLSGETMVAVGKGSYADRPPPEADAKAREFDVRPLNLVKEDERPIPSNQWWTDLLVSKYARSLWPFPFKIDTNQDGLEVFFPKRWASEGNDLISEFPLRVGGQDFKAADARAKDWSDWGLVFRMGESAARHFDVTLLRGSPCVWIEYHGVQPELGFQQAGDAHYFDLTGQALALPATADCLGIDYHDRCYGVFAPDGTQFRVADKGVKIAFSGPTQYLVVCALPGRRDMPTFHRHAFAIPRVSKLSWTYEPAKGTVTTIWQITTEALKGSERQVIQGWLPHHYRNTRHDLAFNGLDYLSPRGKLRCTPGNEFHIAYRYSGIVPNLPAPKPLSGKHPFDPARMRTYLEMLAAKASYGADTYWGGKDILRFGQDALMAQQLQEPTQKTFVEHLRTALADWFTYRPGKTERYFARYPRWKGLVGFKTSYGSEGFNDHHFHYGYFTWATALLGAHDRQFLADYGDMARLVAKEYANSDRADRRFPFLRTFDIWEGHSWAGGISSPGGNNQESSSEAVQALAGLILLGEALDDKAMTATGVLGYCMETQAILEYWFNAGGDVFPPEWKHPVTGMVWSGGKLYGTYFTGDPAWIYAINWLPASPALAYLVRDPDRARRNYAEMIRDFEAKEKKPATIKQFGTGLGSVMLGYVLLYDPDWVAEQLDTLWAEPGDKVAHEASEMAIMYYMAHAMRRLGRVDWTCHTSSPTAVVYQDPATGTRTYVAWNPRPKAQTVQVYENDQLLGRMTAPPQALTSVTSLSGPAESPKAP